MSRYFATKKDINSWTINQRGYNLKYRSIAARTLWNYMLDIIGCFGNNCDVAASISLLNRGITENYRIIVWWKQIHFRNYQ